MLQLKHKQTNAEALHDRVYAAMETGNTGYARQVIAENHEENPEAVARIRTDVLNDYGIRL